MNLDGEEIVKYVESDPKFKPELDSFYKSIKLLPQYDYSKFYSNLGSQVSIIEQGDGLTDLIIINLPSTETKKAPSMVFSNACDIDMRNERAFNTRIIYAPVIRFDKYIQMLKDNGKYSDGHVKAIRNQEIGQIFYLPPGHDLDYEGIVFFSNMCSCDNEHIERSSLEEKRLFRLSSYGWYIFLSKLSLFFLRFNEDTVQLRFNGSSR